MVATYPLMRFFGYVLLMTGIAMSVLVVFYPRWPDVLFHYSAVSGAVLVVLSYVFHRMDTAWQLLIGYVPFLAGLLWLAIAAPAEEIIYLPEGFTGTAIIHYNMGKEGENTRYEGSTKVLVVGESGELKTRFSWNNKEAGTQNTRYFFLLQNGEKQPIAERNDNQEGIYILSDQFVQEKPKVLRAITLARRKP
jgi:hypothetical protein